ncbi:MAG: M3 family oligoendopeptidase [Rhodothermales bacterium]|nr:M3 family oligoendopeptidase [Rhodothermales bacterium]MBO6779721.1 M3 family oligoendopeptidase [Rhodothermales bacterium]
MSQDLTTGAEDITWDLTDLYADSDALTASVKEAATLAGDFEEQYRGTVAELDAAALAAAMSDLGAIQDMVGRAYTYAYLAWSTDTADEKTGAQLQAVREAYTGIAKRILFFDLEWAEVDDEKAGYLLGDDQLGAYRHYLEVLRLTKPYQLSEPEEKILVEKSVTGRSAWNRFFDETMGAVRFDFDGDSLTQQELMAKLYASERDTRRAAALSFTEGLKTNARPLAFIFNTILADKASDDRLRGYPHWLKSRNISNEVQDEVVDSLIESVTSRFDIVGRFYRLKARLLGLDEMMDYDRYAPVGEADTRYAWDEARSLVLDAYGEFHPDMGAIASEFFDKRWIDARLAPNKRSGAFSHGAVPSAHPYVLVNYTGKIRDVQTLAHELGHGVHQYLSRKQGVFHADTPLTTAETASVFGEMLVFQRLMAAESDPKNRLAMLVSKIDDSIATVFRQVAMNRFEDAIHTARREQGELSVDGLSEAWIGTQTAMFDGAVTLGDHYRYWWSYIPHFLHTPGYVYAYAFGELLVLALYARYQEEGAGFPEKYLTLLSDGGSDWPHVLVGKLGIDLTDLSFWSRGLDAIDALVSQAEELAA